MSGEDRKTAGSEGQAGAGGASPPEQGPKLSSRRWIRESTVRRGTVALAALACAAVAFGVFCLVRHAALSIGIKLAREQVQVMAYAVDRALRAEPKEAVAHLEYVLGYYPTGTKQSAGTELDAIVETHRRVCTRLIVEHLRAATGEDLGDDPRAWVERFGSR